MKDSKEKFDEYISYINLLLESSKEENSTNTISVQKFYGDCLSLLQAFVALLPSVDDIQTEQELFQASKQVNQENYDRLIDIFNDFKKKFSDASRQEYLQIDKQRKIQSLIELMSQGIAIFNQQRIEVYSKTPQLNVSNDNYRRTITKFFSEFDIEMHQQYEHDNSEFQRIAFDHKAKVLFRVHCHVRNLTYLYDEKNGTLSPKDCEVVKKTYVVIYDSIDKLTVKSGNINNKIELFGKLNIVKEGFSQLSLSQIENLLHLLRQYDSNPRFSLNIADSNATKLMVVQQFLQESLNDIWIEKFNQELDSDIAELIKKFKLIIRNENSGLDVDKEKKQFYQDNFKKIKKYLVKYPIFKQFFDALKTFAELNYSNVKIFDVLKKYFYNLLDGIFSLDLNKMKKNQVELISIIKMYEVLSSMNSDHAVIDIKNADYSKPNLKLELFDIFSRTVFKMRENFYQLMNGFNVFCQCDLNEISNYLELNNITIEDDSKKHPFFVLHKMLLYVKANFSNSQSVKIIKDKYDSLIQGSVISVDWISNFKKEFLYPIFEEVNTIILTKKNEIKDYEPLNSQLRVQAFLVQDQIIEQSLRSELIDDHSRDQTSSWDELYKKASTISIHSINSLVKLLGVEEVQGDFSRGEGYQFNFESLLQKFSEYYFMIKSILLDIFQQISYECAELKKETHELFNKAKELLSKKLPGLDLSNVDRHINLLEDPKNSKNVNSDILFDIILSFNRQLEQKLIVLEKDDFFKKQPKVTELLQRNADINKSIELVRHVDVVINTTAISDLTAINQCLGDLRTKRKSKAIIDIKDMHYKIHSILNDKDSLGFFLEHRPIFLAIVRFFCTIFPSWLNSVRIVKRFNESSKLLNDSGRRLFKIAKTCDYHHPSDNAIIQNNDTANNQRQP